MGSPQKFGKRSRHCSLWLWCRRPALHAFKKKSTWMRNWFLEGAFHTPLWSFPHIQFHRLPRFYLRHHDHQPQLSSDDKYHRGHCCASKVFLLIADEENPPVINIEGLDQWPASPDSNDLLQTQISFNSLTSHLALETLRLLGFLSGHQVVILMDGDSTHNFIQEELVTKLGFSSRETIPLRVMVGNGQHLKFTRWCEAITIEIQMTKFIIDLYVLPISRANIVLGVQWLKSLEPILTDYNTLCMKFFHNGCLVELKGDHESTLSSLTPP